MEPLWSKEYLEDFGLEEWEEVEEWEEEEEAPEALVEWEEEEDGLIVK